MMAYCQNCGVQIPDGAKFCPNCGEDIGAGSSPKGSITFIRRPAVPAKAVPTRVTVDGALYGELMENEQVTVRLPYGTHTVKLKAAMNPALTQSVQVMSSNGVDFPFKISMSGKPVRLEEPAHAVEPGIASEKKKPKKKIGLIILGIIALLLILIIIIPSGNSGDEKSSEKPSSSIESPEPAFEPRTQTVGDWEVTVSDFSFEKSVSAGLVHSYTAEDGSHYCLIDVTAKNLGTESQTFLPVITWSGDTVAKLTWGKYEYKRSDLLFSNDTLSNETLNPLVSATGKIAFEVPDELIESDTPPVLVISDGDDLSSFELVKTN